MKEEWRERRLFELLSCQQKMKIQTKKKEKENIKCSALIN